MTPMTWEYRVTDRNGELAIYEVYYYEDGRVRGYSATPAFPTGVSLEELRDACNIYAAALAKPVLQYED